jgi:hypothetical protein
MAYRASQRRFSKAAKNRAERRENDVNNDSVDLQPCGLQAALSRDMETANQGLCKAQRAAGDYALQTLADPCQSLRVQATSHGDDNAPFPIQSATEQHARDNSGKKSVRFTDSELNCGTLTWRRLPGMNRTIRGQPC